MPLLLRERSEGSSQACIQYSMISKSKKVEAKKKKRGRREKGGAYSEAELR